MGMNHWEWEEMGLKNTFPHTSNSRLSKSVLKPLCDFLSRTILEYDGLFVQFLLSAGVPIFNKLVRDEPLNSEYP